MPSIRSRFQRPESEEQNAERERIPAKRWRHRLPGCSLCQRRPVIDLETSGRRTERGFALDNWCRGLEN